MKKIVNYVNLLAAVAFAFAVPTSAFADNQQAIYTCVEKIQSIYGVKDFRNTSADRLGHNKFKVYGKAKYNDHKYPFNCKIKNGRVKSYHYDGPHANSASDDSDLGAAVAIGAGLAIIGALAASSMSSNSDNSSSSNSLQIDKNRLEDECHDELSYRMRDEHHTSADVRIMSSEIHRNELRGDGKVRWANSRADHFTYTCHFDDQGWARDSQYYLY